MSERLYFDNAATTRPLPAVVADMARAQVQCFGNPSSAHSFGQPAKRLLEDAREFLRGTLGAGRLVFTSGGSEADALGIIGAAAIRPPGRVLMTRADHPALLATTPVLARYRHQVSQLPCTVDGDLAPETLFEALGSDVRVVALMHGHNELGTLSRLEELIELVRRTAPKAHVHVDLVQAYGKIAFEMGDLGIDSVAVSGHKFHGPRGAGFLALSNQAELGPLQLAGGQEGGLRGGTENVAGAVGMATAADHVFSHLRARADACERAAQWLLEAVTEVLPDAERLGHPERRLPHILSLRLPNVVGETLMLRCDADGLAFSTGSACHSRAEGAPQQPDNHVLAAIGMDRRQAREVVRISFAGTESDAELTRAADLLAQHVRRLRQEAPARFADGATAP